MYLVNRAGDYIPYDSVTDAGYGVYKYNLSHLGDSTKTYYFFEEDGKLNRSKVNEMDIVRVCGENVSPIREVIVTKYELVPGDYGKVRITEGGYVRVNSTNDKDEIEHAISILQKALEAF